jgi:hypothetical protein
VGSAGNSVVQHTSPNQTLEPPPAQRNLVPLAYIHTGGLVALGMAIVARAFL